MTSSIANSARAALACLVSVLAIGSALADTLPSVVRELRRGIFLVADKSLVDVNFSRSVVLLTDHGIVGSIGLIINKASSVAVVSTLPQLEGLEDSRAPLRFGGPVEITSVRLLVANAADIPSATRLIEGVYFVNNTMTLQSLLEHKGSSETPTINYYAGYAGWTSGQLAAEIARGDWYLIKADAATIFEQDPDTIWPELIEKLEGTWVLLDNADVADVKAVTNRPSRR
jgi:putative transcriptional regulator